jgi:hypothetical protein
VVFLCQLFVGRFNFLDCFTVTKVLHNIIFLVNDF